MRFQAASCAFVVLLAACSVGPAGRPEPGTVRFDIAKDPDTLNPLFLHPDAASVEPQLARLAFEPFVDLDPTGRLVPALLRVVPTAANGGISKDGRTLVYHLRDIEWSDGVPVTSSDVLFTLKAILDPDNPVRSHEGYDDIDRASAPDARTVVLHLKRPWAPAATTYFSYGASPQFVLPAHVLRLQGPLSRAPFNAAPTVGDGPFTFVAWQRGQGLRYQANARYWRGTPRLARLDVRITPDPSTNLLLLQSGALDWNLIAPAQYQIVARNPHLRFVSVPTAVVAGIAIATNHPPLDDVRIRRAIAMSIDRDSISAKITLGRYPVADSLQPQFSWAYDPRVREPRANARAADALFDAAGWSRGPGGIRSRNGTPLQLTYVQFPESMTGVRVATAVQAELRDRGVGVTVKSVSNAQLFLPKTGTLATGKFDLAYVPFTMGADPDDAFVLSCDGPSNYMRWCDRQVDTLERDAIAEPSQTRRRVLYGRIARIVADQVPIVYLFNARYTYAYGDRLTNFAPNAFLPTWNAGAWQK